MKRLWVCLIAVCLLGCAGLPAAAQSLPGEEAQADVLARYMETFDESTAVAAEKDGSFTLTAQDGARLTVTAKAGGLPEGARLMVVTAPQDSDAYRWFSSVLDKGRLRVYALYFVKDGERLPFTGELSLSVTEPDGMAEPRVYRVSPDGASRELPFETREGMVHLTAAYNAPYVVLADVAGPSGVPETGDAGYLSWLLAAGVAALLLLTLGRPYIRKKKEDAR